MELILVRHGIAEDANGKKDSERALTGEGKDRSAKVARVFRKRVDWVDLILHSPFKRAVETAEIFGQEFPNTPLRSVANITPIDSPKEALLLVQQFSGMERVMLVGHEPHLSGLASLLLTGEERRFLEFRKAGIACFEWGGPGGSYLSYLLTPKFLV